MLNSGVAILTVLSPAKIPSTELGAAGLAALTVDTDLELVVEMADWTAELIWGVSC